MNPAIEYDQPGRPNIHKSGQEIDIGVGRRTEPGHAIAECKVTKDKTGGGGLEACSCQYIFR